MDAHGFTTQPVAAPWGADPEWVDHRGLKNMFGIGRSLSYLLIEHDDIVSKVLRRKGCIKGKRLFFVPSIRQYIAKQSDEVDPRLTTICKNANRRMREKRAARKREGQPNE
jgi:hypothetical protein